MVYNKLIYTNQYQIADILTGGDAYDKSTENLPNVYRNVFVGQIGPGLHPLSRH